MPQRLYTIEDDGSKKPKGIKLILENEDATQTLAPGAKCNPRCPDPLVYFPPELPTCCLPRILQNHKDFREQKSVLAEIIEGAGHKCVFIPKFHCELDPIEMYWGYSKARFRQVLKTSFDHAKEEVVIALEACSIELCEGFATVVFGLWTHIERSFLKGRSVVCQKTEGSQEYFGKNHEGIRCPKTLIQV